MKVRVLLLVLLGLISLNVFSYIDCEFDRDNYTHVQLSTYDFFNEIYQNGRVVEFEDCGKLYVDNIITEKRERGCRVYMKVRLEFDGVMRDVSSLYFGPETQSMVKVFESGEQDRMVAIMSKERVKYTKGVIISANPENPSWRHHEIDLKKGRRGDFKSILYKTSKRYLFSPIPVDSKRYYCR